MIPLALALVVAAVFAPQAARAAPSIEDAVNRRIRDLQATATLGDADLAALRKIGKDYADAYRFKTMETYLKEPGCVRFEMKALGLTFTYVINGNVKYTSVPRLRIRQTSDISTRPQTRQSSMEIGLLTPSSLRDFRVKFLREERLHGSLLPVFELRYRQQDQRKKKILLWVDPQKHVLARRELYHDSGLLKARFTYHDPCEAARGIWVPTRITVHNADGELGGTTSYSHIRVNTGLPDSLFQGSDAPAGRALSPGGS